MCTGPLSVNELATFCVLFLIVLFWKAINFSKQLFYCTYNSILFWNFSHTVWSPFPPDLCYIPIWIISISPHTRMFTQEVEIISKGEFTTLYFWPPYYFEIHTSWNLVTKQKKLIQNWFQPILLGLTNVWAMILCCVGVIFCLLPSQLQVIKNSKWPIFSFTLFFFFMYSKASRYADFGSRKKQCSSKPHFVRFIPMY